MSSSWRTTGSSGLSGVWSMRVALKGEAGPVPIRAR
jgi:hypothetical protein